MLFSPHSLPCWNCLHAESHTSFITEYDYLNYRAGCGSKYCVQFPYWFSSLGNGAEEQSRTWTLHGGEWKGPSSGWSTKIHHHARDIFLHKYSSYLSSSSSLSAYSSSVPHCCNQMAHKNIPLLSPAPSFSLTAPHDFLTSYSGKPLLSSSLMLCSSVGLRLWEILSITNEYLILDQNLSLVQPPALLISLFPWDTQEWDVMTRP